MVDKAWVSFPLSGNTASGKLGRLMPPQRPMGHSQESCLGSLYRGVGGVGVGQQG